jgi:acyl-CoA reductase-like NAD-dependent aldehyde dehydrogenase
MEMLIGGRWRPASGPGAVEEVTSPFDGAVVGTVPVATVEDVDAALTAAQAGAGRWRRTPAHERMRVLLRAAELADDRAEETARLISGECGSKHVGVVGAFAGRRKPHARRPNLGFS